MAKANRNTAARRRTLRASERNGIKLDVSAATLRDLMTEQSKTSSGYATYYVGARQELRGAGIPDHVFPRGQYSAFRANGQDASIQRNGDSYELTLHWDDKGPWYYSAAHPALSEIARMILIDINWWLERDSDKGKFGADRTFEVNTEKLIEGGAADYRLPAHKRFKFAPDFLHSLFGLTMDLHRRIQMAEIMPLEPTKPKRRRTVAGNVVNIESARRSHE